MRPRSTGRHFSQLWEQALRRSSSRAERPRGLTLYEVVLAVVILLGAMLALGQLLSNGSRAALDAQLRSDAILLCRSRLAEIRAGVLPLQSVDNQALPDGDGRWTWSAALTGGPLEELIAITVTVSHSSASGTINHQYSLTQWMQDPAVLADAAAAAETASAGGSTTVGGGL